MTKVAVCAVSGLFLSLALPLLNAADGAGKENNKGQVVKKVEIQAKVHYVGNTYSRLPNGTIIGTLRAFPYEGCFIMLNGRQVNLVFQPAMELVDQQSFGGRTLILTGTLNQDVFVVTGYRDVPAAK
jgi:hypothetical protein